jgi:hypothetical protein
VRHLSPRHEVDHATQRSRREHLAHTPMMAAAEFHCRISRGKAAEPESVCRILNYVRCVRACAVPPSARQCGPRAGHAPWPPMSPAPPQALPCSPGRVIRYTLYAATDARQRRARRGRRAPARKRYTRGFVSAWRVGEHCVYMHINSTSTTVKKNNAFHAYIDAEGISAIAIARLSHFQKCALRTRPLTCGYVPYVRCASASRRAEGPPPPALASKRPSKDRQSLTPQASPPADGTSVIKGGSGRKSSSPDIWPMGRTPM